MKKWIFDNKGQVIIVVIIKRAWSYVVRVHGEVDHFGFDSYEVASPKVLHYSWLSLIGLLNGMKTIECITMIGNFHEEYQH